MWEVMEFLRTSLNLEASPEKSKVSKASDGTVFLGYEVRTDTGDRVRRTRLGRRATRSRDPGDRIHLRVPRDRLVRFNQRRGYGDLGRLKAIHRRYLIDSSVLEIVLAYNAEMRGLANYYRLAYFAKYSLRKLWFLWLVRVGGSWSAIPGSFRQWTRICLGRTPSSKSMGLTLISWQPLCSTI